MSGEAEGRHEKAAAMPEGTGRNPEGIGCGASSIATTKGYCSQERQDLMEAVVERGNMERALRRVMSNKGVPGVDGLRVEDLRGWCIRHWPALKEALLAGEYQPQPVLGVEIPKSGGGMRQLGIPTAVDRLIQQAMHQVLSPLFEPGFSESSYGFRPGRNAHQAVLKAREYVSEGRRFVVDIDLEKFFDRVNHACLWPVWHVGSKIHAFCASSGGTCEQGCCKEVWKANVWRVHRKAAPFPRYSPISCWMT